MKSGAAECCFRSSSTPVLIPYIHIFVLHRRFYERERPYHLTPANCTSVVCSYAKPELLGGMSNRFALHTAPLRNAQLAGIGEVTGSIAPGKSADFIVTRENPLEDLRALQHLELVVCCGRAVKNPSPKRRKEVDAPWFPDPDLCPEQRPGSLHLVQTHVGVGYRMLRVEPDEL